jgi:hypothetical protein
MHAARDRLCTFVVRAAEYKFGFKKKKKKSCGVAIGGYIAMLYYCYCRPHRNFLT